MGCCVGTGTVWITRRIRFRNVGLREYKIWVSLFYSLQEFLFTCTKLSIVAIQIFWNVRLCCLASRSRRFERSYCLHSQDQVVLLETFRTKQFYKTSE
jgi:hypothetical protein